MFELPATAARHSSERQFSTISTISDRLCRTLAGINLP